MKPKIPLVAPFEINSQVTPMGCTDLNYLLGNYYIEVNRSLLRAGYNSYSLFFSKWEKPGPLDFAYSPDAYDYLLNGERALEFKSPHVMMVSNFNLIETTGGLDTYLSRLKSKKRSEFKKLQGRATVTDVVYDSDLIDSLMIQGLNEYYDAERMKREDDWFGWGFQTNKAPINLMLYAGHYAEPDGMLRHGLKRLLLNVYNSDGEYVCRTLCFSDHKDKVLYALSDELKNKDLYSAKEVTIANIEWACNNGYSYVEIDNGIVTEESVADPSALIRVSYKNLFYTGLGSIPRFFSTQSAFETFLNMECDEEEIGIDDVE